MSGGCPNGLVSIQVPWSKPLQDYGSSLAYNQARAAVNGHLFGADHGIKPDKLGLQRRYTMYESGPQVSYLHTREATIVDGELIVAVSREYESKDGSHGFMRALAWILQEKPCNHVFVILAGALSPHGLANSYSVPGSCDKCLTDWEATAHHQNDAGDGKDSMGCRLTLVSFHQLGSCRSPTDWKWATQVQQGGKSCRKIDRGGNKPESVRRKWRVGPYGYQGKELDRRATKFGPWSIYERISTRPGVPVQPGYTGNWHMRQIRPGPEDILSTSEGLLSITRE